MQTPRDAGFAQLFSRRVGEIKPGLQRIQRALDYQTNSFDPLQITIGGTNGKGSTAGYLFMRLADRGYRVGLFSSPHLRFFRERFQVSDQQITDHSIEMVVDRLRHQLPASLFDELSFLNSMSS